MEEFLKIAIVQTTLDQRLAWNTSSPDFPTMAKLEADRIWEEIQSTATSIHSLPDSERPHIVVIPEFGVARDKMTDVINISDKLGAIVISGLDFRRDGVNVYNEGIVAIPYNWPNNKGKSKRKHFLFGKVFASPEERQNINSHIVPEGNIKFKSAEAIYMLDLDGYGKIGLAICAEHFISARYERASFPGSFICSASDFMREA